MHFYTSSKFFRCQWKNEGTLRKHRIVKNRNRDTVLYSMLNSDWIAASIVLKKHIGLDWKPKTVKIADIQSGKEAIPTSVNSNSNEESNRPVLSESDISASSSVSPTAVLNSSCSKRSPNKKKSTPKKQSDKSESSDEEDLIVRTMESPSKRPIKSKENLRPENISHAIFSSVETPLQTDQSHPLDLSDPKLYVEDHVTIPVDWQTVEKRSKKKK